LLEDSYNQSKAKYGPLDGLTFNSAANLAEAFRVNGKPDQALSLLEETFRVTKDKLGPDNGRTIQVMGWVAGHHQATGSYEKAVAIYKDALDLAKAKAGAKDPDGQMSEQMFNLAEAYLAAGRYDEAVRLFHETVALLRSLPSFPNTDFGAYNMNQFGRDLLQKKHAAEAESVLRECLAIRQKEMPNDPRTFETQSLLGDALLSQKKFAEAEPILLQAEEGLRRRLTRIDDSDRHFLPESAERLVRLYEGTKQPEKALAWREKLDARVKAYGPLKHSKVDVELVPPPRRVP
jgi:tetratricopeptide (TPR) repeat protein